MSGNQIYSRLVCSNVQVDLLRFRSGVLYEQDYPMLTMAAGVIDTLPIYLADTAVSGYDDASIRALIRKSVKKLGGKMVVIDYLQLISIIGHRGNRESEVGQISRNLKQLARGLNIPVVAIAQLSRKCEEGLDKRPTLSSLRESGALEQDADVVIFLYRDEYYFKDKSKEKGVCEAIIGKQRNGPTCTIKLQFAASFARFGNLDLNRPEMDNQGQEQEEKQYCWTD